MWSFSITHILVIYKQMWKTFEKTQSCQTLKYKKPPSPKPPLQKPPISGFPNPIAKLQASDKQKTLLLPRRNSNKSDRTCCFGRLASRGWERITTLKNKINPQSPRYLQQRAHPSFTYLSPNAYLFIYAYQLQWHTGKKEPLYSEPPRPFSRKSTDFWDE